MKELIKTVAFLAVGLVLGLSALAVNYMSKPKGISQFEFVGEEFFPDFRSPEDAKYLEVAAYDEEASQAKKFRVEFKDGLWRIPSHYDYPAEAKDRLVKTATSVIGIRREALAGRENEHERFGVIDPLSEDIKDAEAVGKRISLGGSDEEVLADYIVGKQVEEETLNDEQLREIRGQAARQPMYYVRRPEEVETYMATLNLDVSTKFSDWIEPDLLKLEASNLRQLVIDKYTVEHREEEIRRGPLVMLASRPVKIEEELFKLTRDTDFGPWKLDGLNEETEELESSKISTLTSSLDNLEILGVRPRFQIDGQPLLTADLQLSIPPSMRTDRDAIEGAIDQVQSDLASKGYAIDVDQSGDDPKARLLSDKGELTCGTSEGVVYHLHFGNVFLGSDTEIEIGGNEEKTVSVDEDTEESKADSKDAEGDGKKTTTEDGGEENSDGKSSGDSSASEEGDDDAKDSTSEKKSRYLLVRVEYDPELIDGKPFKPIKPVEPKKPESTDQPEKKDQPDETKPDEDNVKQGSEGTDKKPSEEKSGDEDADKSDDEKAGDAKSSDEDSAGEESSCVDLNQDDADNAQVKEKDESQDGDADDKEEPAETDENSSDDSAADDEPKKPEDGENTDDDPTSEKQDGEETEPKLDPEEEYQQAMAAYQFALQQYANDEKKYEEDLKAYEKKLEKGQEKVDELNERFAAWYYVISAENLDSLRLSRADLVKDKPKPEEDPDEKEEPGTTEQPWKDGDSQPSPDGDEKDGDKKDGDEKDGDKKDGDKKDGEKKDGDKKDGEKKDGEKKDGEKKDGEKKDGEKKDGDKKDGEKKDGEKKDGEKKDGEKKDGDKKDGEKKDGEKKDGEKKDGEKKDGEKKDGDEKAGDEKADDEKADDEKNAPEVSEGEASEDSEKQEESP